MQLAAQSMCLEEMLCCNIDEAMIYYGETRRRLCVKIDNDVRNKVKACVTEMHQLFERCYTPKVKPSKSCNACSLKDLCLPKLMRAKNAGEYISTHMNEEAEDEKIT